MNESNLRPCSDRECSEPKHLVSPYCRQHKAERYSKYYRRNRGKIYARARERVRERAEKGTCTQCGNFPARDNLRTCQACANRNRRTRWRNRYGITEDAMAALYFSQDGRCAICGGVLSECPDVDHDHDTKMIRGLLCSPCNMGIGKLGDDPVVVARAADYLSKFND